MINLAFFILICLFYVFIGSIFTNQVIYRTCYILLGYNKTDCSRLGKEANNDTKYLEKMVEPTADVILMYKSIADSLFPIFICMIAGPWSDKNGRKPVLLMTLIGTYIPIKSYMISDSKIFIN